MKVWGFAKLRNEILGGNAYRMLEQISATCEGGILCDDASTDGTAERLRDFVAANPKWILLEVPAAAQNFDNELTVKQEMLTLLHAKAAAEGAPDWILWLDADETVADPSALLRELEDLLQTSARGLKNHYTQLWRSEVWARTDQSFDDGVFLKAWRYSPELSFNTKPGTHHQQFPQQLNHQQAWLSKVDIIHWGNATTAALVRKATQYASGRGGVDRHIAFGHPVSESMATGIGFDQAKWSAPHPTYRYVGKAYDSSDTGPKPFTLEEIKRIRSFGGLKREPGLFCVVLPTFNRAKTLPRALDSLIAQTYDRWVCTVLDDGSTDNTADVMREYQDKDPRIFYARYPTNRGGVWANEIGMNIACEIAEYWARLGSDDWFGPAKLAFDAKALKNHEACFGLYTVFRTVPMYGRPAGFGEICNPPMTPETIRAALLGGRYVVSWANIAARTEVLRKVKDKFGNFVDPRLHSMEDFNFNARLVSLGVDFIWRGPDGTDATPVPLGVAWDSNMASSVIEAIWNQAPEQGASSPDNAARMARDEALTQQLIRELRK